MKHLVVVNPNSFFGKVSMDSVVRDIKQYFDSLKDSDYLIHISRYPRDAIRITKKYVDEKGFMDTVRVYSVGGDGVLYDCLNGVAGLPNTELAVMPYGISSDFVRAFGDGDISIFRDISKQVNASTIPTDAICLGKRYALNFCSVGIEATIMSKYYELKNRSPWLSKKLGKHYYMAGIPLALLDKEFAGQKYEIEIDGEHFNDVYMGISFANGPCYAGDKTPFPMAHPADGNLEAMFITSGVKLGMLFGAKSYLKGGYHKYPHTYKHMQAKSVFVRSDMPMRVVADGETSYASEVRAHIVPGFVNVVAPDNLSYVVRQGNN